MRAHRNRAATIRSVPARGSRAEMAEPRPAARHAPTQPRTRDRILEAAMELFNERGVQNVAALHVARALDISPGHLGYHFKNKHAIVEAIFPQIDASVRSALEAPPRGEIAVSYAAAYQIRIFRTLWRYRFFFNGLSYVIVPGEQLYDQYLELQAWVLGRLEELNDSLIAARQMRPIEAPNSTALLARNTWTIWLGWLRLEQLSNPSMTTVIERAAILDGVLQHFALNQPYYGRKFAQRLLEDLYRQLDAQYPGSPDH
jgi:AcrR family transcriptional regulator